MQEVNDKFSKNYKLNGGFANAKPPFMKSIQKVLTICR